MSFNRGGNYYEDQFGERIRNLRREGAAPGPPAKPSGSGPSSTGLGRAGIFFVIVALGIARACNSSSSYRTPSYTPPPPMPQFEMPPLPDADVGRRFDGPAGKEDGARKMFLPPDHRAPEANGWEEKRRQDLKKALEEIERGPKKDRDEQP